ncbi:solute carrier family 22 member 8-like [Pomacea canaliculata]|uniref:solute carrier family 22 member 8-like n=1 Tax=Pomacea canaliculata TaxID=400727 RepID=UPI000D735A76|nr:solute carrier family 22 member 8-like [Pomacea canaliculata]
MESLLGEVGAGGRFQVQLVASVKFADMSLAWGMMQMTFAGLVPDWWCQPPEAANSSHGNWSRDNTTFHICPVSNNSDTCGEVVFDDSVQTIVNEWTLVCDLDYVKPMVTSLQMGGVLFGALLGGQVSDSLGRRPTAYLAYLANLIVSLVTAFSISWRMFAIMRVLIGVTLGVKHRRTVHLYAGVHRKQTAAGDCFSNC